MYGEIMSVYKSAGESYQLGWGGLRLWGFHFCWGRLGTHLALSTVCVWRRWRCPQDTLPCCELGEQESSTGQLIPWRNVPALSTLYPFACHLGGICVQGWCWQEALSECNPLPATGEKERFGVVSSQRRDLSRSLLQGHVCTAMAMWQFSVVLWKKRKKGGNTVGIPGLRVPCLSWVMRASATWMRERILCQTVKGNVKYYNGLSISLCIICFLYPFFQVPFCSPPRQTNVIMVSIALAVG